MNWVDASTQASATEIDIRTQEFTVRFVCLQCSLLSKGVIVKFDARRLNRCLFVREGAVKKITSYRADGSRAAFKERPLTFGVRGAALK